MSIEKNRDSYRKFLKGKKVAIVGPAPSILNSNQADLLNSYDVIVRLNKALPVPENLQKDVGSRTDVLYNCMNPSQECGGLIDTELLHKLGVKYLVSPYAPLNGYRFKKDIDNFLKKNRNSKVLFCHFSKDYFRKLFKIMKLPNTGICAILDLLRQDISELYITGFTFFKGGYVKDYRPYSEQEVLKRMAKYNLHNQEKQLRFMKKILSNDSRVKMDKALSEIIHGDTVSFKIKDKISSKNGKTGRHKIRRRYVK